MTFVVSDRTQDTTTSVGPTAFTISGTNYSLGNQRQ